MDGMNLNNGLNNGQENDNKEVQTTPLQQSNELNQGNVVQQNNGINQNNIPQQSNGIYQNNIPQQSNGIYQGNIPQQSNGIYQGNIPQQGNGIYQGNIPQQSNGIYQNNMPQPSNGLYQNNMPQQYNIPYQNNFPNQNIMRQQYPYGANGFPQPKKPLILGFLSMAFSLTALFTVLFTPILGIGRSIISIPLGIASLVKKERAKALPIIGIAFSCIVLIIGSLLILAEAKDGQEVSEANDVRDVFSGHKLTMEDGSTLYLQEDGTYTWFKDDAEQDDNYYTGFFEIYYADAAEDYIVNDLSDYGIGEDELNDFYARNSDDEFYVKENLFCIVMNCSYRLVDGEESEDENPMIPYYGFSDGESYDLVNMNTGNNLVITSITDINNGTE